MFCHLIRIEFSRNSHQKGIEIEHTNDGDDEMNREQPQKKSTPLHIHTKQRIKLPERKTNLKLTKAKEKQSNSTKMTRYATLIRIKSNDNRSFWLSKLCTSCSGNSSNSTDNTATTVLYCAQLSSVVLCCTWYAHSLPKSQNRTIKCGYREYIR